MNAYGNALFSKDGFSLVEVVDTDPNGFVTVVGYAILDPEGHQIGFSDNYDEALAELRRLTEDDEPPPPEFGM